MELFSKLKAIFIKKSPKMAQIPTKSDVFCSPDVAKSLIVWGIKRLNIPIKYPKFGDIVPQTKSFRINISIMGRYFSSSHMYEHLDALASVAKSIHSIDVEIIQRTLSGNTPQLKPARATLYARIAYVPKDSQVTTH